LPNYYKMAGDQRERSAPLNPRSDTCLGLSVIEPEKGMGKIKSGIIPHKFVASKGESISSGSSWNKASWTKKVKKSTLGSYRPRKTTSERELGVEVVTTENNGQQYRDSCIISDKAVLGKAAVCYRREIRSVGVRTIID